jgi:hypothetical protein
LVKLIYKDAVNGINIISDYLGEKKNDWNKNRNSKQARITCQSSS